MRIDELKNSRLGSVLYSFRKEFLWVGFLSLIANLLMLTPTLYMLQVYDRVLLSRSELTLWVLTAVMVFLYSVMAFSEWLRSRLLVRSGVRLDEALNLLVFQAGFEAFLRQAQQKFSRAFADLTQMRQFMTGNGIIAFFDLPWTPLYILVLFLLHPLMGVLGVFFAVLQLVIAWSGHKRSEKGIECAANADADSTGYLQNKVWNIEPIHAMGMARHLKKRWLQRHEQSLDHTSSSLDVQSRQESLSKFARYTMQSLTLGAGALLVIDGSLTGGAMIAGNMLMSRALAPLDVMVGTWKQFIQAREGYGRLNSLLDTCDVEKGRQSRSEVAGRITVQELTATAAEGQVKILESLQTAFKPGELAVIVGLSGSGKSTFARCLVGVWPETGGDVLIDDVPVNAWDKLALGPRIGYLPQDVQLFDGTFAENIARFSKVDPEKVIDAAKRTGIHDMIIHFPQGYDTPIGVAGQLLSGGQRQRLGLARAIYDNPSIIVLDEPNANLDDTGEKALQKVVRELVERNATVVMITHRPGTLALADRIIMMKDGRIVQDGPRDEVLAAMRSTAR